MNEKNFLKEFCEKYGFLLRVANGRLGIAFNFADVEV